jgi:cell wall-associated NlpC family hydrolase
MVDYSDLIGVPFQYGGRGPDVLDCYGLVMECARRNGVTLPDFGFADNQSLVAAMMGASLPQWRECEAKEGAVALIRVGKYVAHVGYVISTNSLIHAWEASGGVSIEPLQQWRHRIVGFYEYAG